MMPVSLVLWIIFVWWCQLDSMCSCNLLKFILCSIFREKLKDIELIEANNHLTLVIHMNLYPRPTPIGFSQLKSNFNYLWRYL